MSESSDKNESVASRTLAHRMIQFIYDRQASGREHWEASFWHKFRCMHPDVAMEPKALRSFYFNEVMRKPSELAGLPHEVVQYINPLFNRFREEVLECRDLVEGIDYVMDAEPAVTPPAADATLPPLQLRKSSADGPVLPSRPTKRYATPTVEQIRNFVAKGLSEVLWTEEEREQKPTVCLKECLSRTATLTKQGVSLTSRVEPGMQCYDSLVRCGLVQPVVSLGNGSSHGDMESITLTPEASSTPKPPALGSVKSASGSASVLLSKDYNTILKHVRSKPRRKFQ